jgi:hypothetical protein
MVSNEIVNQNLRRLGFDEPTIWREMTRTMGDLEKLVWNDPLVNDDVTRAEGVRYLMRLISTAALMSFEIRSDYPQFVNAPSVWLQWGLPATDCLYHFAPAHGNYEYRIRGDRGTAHLFDVEVRVGSFASLGGWKIIDRYTDLSDGRDKPIDLVLSREEQPGNWLKLPEGPCGIVFRQYFNDWNTEDSAHVEIVREDGSFPPPPLTTDQIAKGAEAFVGWLRSLPTAFAEVVRGYYDVPEDTMVFDPIDFGWTELRYGKTAYRCAEDEALILETRLPKSNYWSVQLCSHFWEALDWNRRQTSINGHQAVIDEDGIFRAVVSHSDPGVHNWLDASGHERGLISIRYHRADTLPAPTIRRVKLSELAASLPASTKLISSGERQKSLRDRSSSVARRRPSAV